MLLAASLAVIVTVVVVPNASAVPAAGLCVIVKEPEAVPWSGAHTSCWRDWSSDVCAPDLLTLRLAGQVVIVGLVVSTTVMSAVQVVMRSEERRVGKEWGAVVPKAYDEPDDGLCVIGKGPEAAELSVATNSGTRFGMWTVAV